MLTSLSTDKVSRDVGYRRLFRTKVLCESNISRTSGHQAQQLALTGTSGALVGEALATSLAMDNKKGVIVKEVSSSTGSLTSLLCLASLETGQVLLALSQFVGSF